MHVVKPSWSQDCLGLGSPMPLSRSPSLKGRQSSRLPQDIARATGTDDTRHGPIDLDGDRHTLFLRKDFEAERGLARSGSAFPTFGMTADSIHTLTHEGHHPEKVRHRVRLRLLTVASVPSKNPAPGGQG
jgi:hypothetical protein